MKEYFAQLLNTVFHREMHKRRSCPSYRSNWQRLHLDKPLLVGILLLIGVGFIILYSASARNEATLIRQGLSAALAFSCLFVFAQIPPYKYKIWSPWIYIIGLGLLLVVLVVGSMGNGAKRWLNLGLFRFQPSEIMKFAVPMAVAWYLSHRPLPVSLKSIIVSFLLILIPGLLIAKQPDLGTGLMVMFAGCVVLFFAGISWRFLGGGLAIIGIALPIFYHHLHEYQRQRILTFLNPERDPLGTGYHIIQSKIAVGSGGMLGKGLFHGSQSRLNFLPEHTTDFIFAVCGEELGFVGCVVVILLILFIILRCLYIVRHAQDDFSRLLAAGLSLSFFLSAFVNIGMVTGILPVVGIPLPLVSYGGTSLVTLFIAFGILMSIHTHRAIFTDML